MKKILIIGHSHVYFLKRVYKEFVNSHDNLQFEIISLRDDKYLNSPENGPPQNNFEELNFDNVLKDIRSFEPDKIFLCLHGNQHNYYGILMPKEVSQDQKLVSLFNNVMDRAEPFLQNLLRKLSVDVFLVPPPPPVDSSSPSVVNWKLLKEDSHIETTSFRIHLWEKHCDALCALADKHGARVLTLPASLFSQNRTLNDDCVRFEPLHGNDEYGRRLLKYIFTAVATDSLDSCRLINQKYSCAPPPLHPYVNKPDYCFWKQSISDLESQTIDPVTNPPFIIKRGDKVATAGSCFAQHISKQLRNGGFKFLVTEQYDGEHEEACNRGFYDFSARYGNIYTARQLIQLFDRAFNYYSPIERVWKRHDNGFCDPFRPRIEPKGFYSEEEVLSDLVQHLSAVRRMFLELDVFVFTLGLTECWVSQLDGAAYPLAPGVAGGEFDPSKYKFVNFNVKDVSEDLSSFLQKLRVVNPRSRVILTVSPVPLVATAVDRHVLVSTTYSKSVLRIAAEEISTNFENVFYFPSYEIITGPHAGGNYFGKDRRSVTETGVNHVMRIFMAKMTESDKEIRPKSSDIANDKISDDLVRQADEIALAECDEEMLAR